MEENKYYTPEINEFYVGFEYEIFEPDDNRVYIWKKQVFNKFTFDSEINTYDGEMPFYAGLLEKTIRVKHLDKQDLTELGFKEIGQEEYYLNGDLNSWCIEALYHQSIKSYYGIS